MTGRGRAVLDEIAIGGGGGARGVGTGNRRAVVCVRAGSQGVGNSNRVDADVVDVDGVDVDDDSGASEARRRTTKR